MELLYFNRIKEALKERGLVSVTIQILRKIKSISFQTHHSVWLEKDLNKNIPKLNGFEDYEIIFDGFEEIVEWMRKNNLNYPWMYSEKEISAAREYGHIIPFIKNNGKIIGYTKVALNKVYIRDYDMVFKLGSPKAMFYDTTILAEHRGKRLPQYLKSQIYEYLKEKNINRIYAHIEPWNVASIRSNEGVGFRTIGLNKFVRIFCFKFHSFNPEKFLS